ncbi:MAG: LPS export ABC transporter ATP-binding protein, partial [Myxococcota bacterium]|nr:LPS export ABC transporter ATP-binding protein [Myxococcota bacterium]
GALRSSGGSVTLNGADITGWPLFRRARKGLIYLPQEVSVFSRLSVAQNIELVLETVESDRGVRKARLAELLSELGLSERASQRAGALSGGERRRLEITRALVLEPLFMLLDEPLAGIDPIAVEDIQQIIAELKGRGIGIMITDHNVRETLSVCDRAYILNDGSVLTSGSPEDIVDDERVRQVYLGEKFSLS